MTSRVPFESYRRIDPVRITLAVLAVALCSVVPDNPSPAGDPIPAAIASAELEYNQAVLPILEQYCFGCHADGADEGNFTLDDYPSTEAMISDSTKWWSVLKNVRSDVMPPDGEDRPADSEKQLLFDWITRYPFGAATGKTDPGKNVLRRLNRLEYRNTIRDLMGIEFDTSVEFPPDDSGNGFDNNADALSISPLLAEKYLDAASEIVDRAVPQTSRVVPVQVIDKDQFEINLDSKSNRLSFDTPAAAKTVFRVEHEATYRLIVPIEIDGSFDFNPGRARVQLLIDDRVLHDKEYGWQNDFVKVVSLEIPLNKDEHTIRLQLDPVESRESGDDPSEHEGTFVRLEIPTATIEGPLDQAYWDKPEGYERFFHRDDPPSELGEQSEYAAEVLRRFCQRAYRRPVDENHLGRLLDVAGLTTDALSEQPDDVSKKRNFEQRVGRAMTAVLASPRFLFRIEEPADDSSEQFPKIDDYSLASRLSYFLWSTMPDKELMRLAEQGTLKSKMDEQVERMLRSDRSDMLIDHFVGQWLQTRDVESVSIDPLAAQGLREEYDELSDYLESTETGRREPPENASAEHHAAYKRYREIREFRERLDGDVRRDMRRETERLFSYVMRDDRSLIELIQSDYAFLNERLAKHYDVAGVEGDQIRKVDLPNDSPLGGVLTQGTFLLVTSNPTRTSPVKRGLFILDNILGTPAPPAPASVPELEASAEHSEIKNPTLRQLLELHRSESLCRSCHARFDPLGLAFENFTAIGTWRDQENGQPIEPGGRLISGESFQTVSELKQVLAGPRHLDFYRCLAERMLSYAIGRSLDFGDEVVLERIVHDMEQHGGRASKLISGVVHSATFQRMRRIRDDINP